MGFRHGAPYFESLTLMFQRDQYDYTSYCCIKDDVNVRAIRIHNVTKSTYVILFAIATGGSAIKTAETTKLSGLMLIRQ